MASFSMLVPKSSRELLSTYSEVFLKHSRRNIYRFCILFGFTEVQEVILNENPLSDLQVG